jgi:PAS domain S-box-containing protein
MDDGMDKPHCTVLIVSELGEPDAVYKAAFQDVDSVRYQLLWGQYEQQTLNVCQERPVDVVLLAGYPQADQGFKFFHRLRSLGPAHCPAPAIIVIGDDDLENAVELLKQGATDYLVGDRLSPETLRKAVWNAIEPSDSLDQGSQEPGASSPSDLHNQRNRQLGQVLDSLFSFVGMLTPHGILLEANRAALKAASLRLQDVLGKPFEQTYWWAYSPTIQAHLRDAIAQAATGITVRYETQARLGDDHYIILDCALVPLANPTGLVEYVIVSGIDITERKQVEASLRESQSQLQQRLAEIESIYHSAPIGLNFLDRNLRFVRINQRLADINGLPIEAHIGRTVREVLPDLADTAEQLLQPILETGAPLLNVEIHGETPAQPGVKRTWLEHFLPLKQGDRVIGINTVCEEITQRKRAEAEVAANEARLRGFVESNVVGILYGDIYGNIRTANDELLRIIGYTREELDAGKLRWPDITPPEYLPLDAQAIAEARQKGACTPYEKEYIRRDGTRIPVLVGYSLVGEKREESVAFILDLSDRKRAEAALRQSEERYRMLFESMEDGFCVIELIFDEAENPIDYRFLEINPAFAQHTGLCDAEGKMARQLLPDLEKHWFEIYGSVALTGEPCRFESESVVMNRWFDVYAFRIGSEGSRKVALLFKDISDRKAFEAQQERLLQQEQAARREAERANRIKDEFLAILSHELRSPLNPILGWAKLLQTRKLSDAQITEALVTIERNAKLQTQLVDDLLDIARILRGKLKLEPQPVQLAEVIYAAVDTVRTAANAKSIDLQVTFGSGEVDNGLSPARLLQISGDAARIQQILWNLLSNAIKFTPEGGHVHVWLERIEDHAQIMVQDTGKGISPDFLPHLFESFRQEDISITRQHGGLGLGLSIVRYLVEAHGGTIAADSPGEGKGATFTVWFPLLPDIATCPNQPQSPSELNLQGIRVLAVDDAADARDLLVALLNQYGAEVSTAASGAEALQTLDSFHPDVLISDIGMPGMDGYELLQQIRARPLAQSGQVPAIALTAYAREEDAQSALDNGYQCHLAKPIDVELLVRLVRQLAENHLRSNL